MEERKSMDFIDTENEYIVSVITPCHEASLELLRKAFDSLKAQSLAFEQLEWIVVVHNSSSDNLRQVEEMVAPYTNVRLYKLRNEFHAASSPRNYALKRIRGTYVTFLDADDLLESDYLEQVVKGFSDEAIDAVFASMKKVNIDEKRKLKTGIGKKYDGNGEAVQIIDCGPDCESDMMHGSDLAVTAKTYRSSVILKHEIMFNEEVPIAEDVLFNLQFLSYGRKVCLLKDFAGYIYSLRDDSEIQSMNKASSRVLLCGMGFLKVLSYGYEKGFYMDNLLLDLIGYESAIVMASVNLEMKHRKELKSAFAPYIAKLADVKPTSRYDDKLLKILKIMPKIVLLHPYFMSFVAAMMRLFRVDTNKMTRKINEEK
ncbi:MAG: glycosyltransferase [Lachnospiraceae bacterium]|nr:glycosyltransferase [Lachnospiraceae bacterium]